MGARVLAGTAASPGVAVGPARVVADPLAAPARHGGDSEAAARIATDALVAAGAELEQTAQRMRAQGNDAEAEIVAAGALMGGDPALAADVGGRIEAGAHPAAAITAAADAFAEAIAAIDDPVLASRADDVRAFGRRAARIAAGGHDALAGAGEDDVVIARELGPAEIAQAGRVAAIALAAGGPTAHAAIVARSLGIPLVVLLGDSLLGVADGEPVVVDGTRGSVVLDPDAKGVERARAEMRSRLQARAATRAQRELPARTTDGHTISVLTNAAGAIEVNAGIDAGAEGVGLLRTELAFLESESWPGEADHFALLSECAAAAGERVLTVRLLDFGGDKTPPFLRGEVARGIALLLGAREHLREQLRAAERIREQAPGMRLLLPLAESAEQVEAVRELLSDDVALGAMIETRVAVQRAGELAAACRFLSIGTNDLSHDLLGSDRFGGGVAPAHHPAVLDAIATVADAAHEAGLRLEVCGEAASDPIAMPLLLGLGVDELSVGASRVGAVRRWVRALSFAQASALADAARRAPDAAAVAELASAELGDRLGE